MKKNNNELIRIENLKIYFDIKGFFKTKHLKAVNDVSFSVNKGEIFCLVGESGCGKTTTGKAILNLYKPTSGNIFFNNEKIEFKDKKKLKEFRKKVQMIFQDPYSTLDPNMIIEDIIAEPLNIYKVYKNESEKKKRIIELMELINLPLDYLNRYPHELSGGQRQRVSIARSLALKPDLIVCDEPISALDVSIQAQIINVFLELQEKLKLTYIFITHNLLVVKFIANRVAVMYLGRIVELAENEELFSHPMHPYTLLLLDSILSISTKEKKNNFNNVTYNNSEIANPLDDIIGCPFRFRCKKAKEQCKEELPTLKELKDKHFVACFFPEKYNK